MFAHPERFLIALAVSLMLFAMVAVTLVEPSAIRSEPDFTSWSATETDR